MNSSTTDNSPRAEAPLGLHSLHAAHALAGVQHRPEVGNSSSLAFSIESLLSPASTSSIKQTARQQLLQSNDSINNNNNNLDLHLHNLQQQHQRQLQQHQLHLIQQQQQQQRQQLLAATSNTSWTVQQQAYQNQLMAAAANLARQQQQQQQQQQQASLASSSSLVAQPPASLAQPLPPALQQHPLLAPNSPQPPAADANSPNFLSFFMAYMLLQQQQQQQQQPATRTQELLLAAQQAHAHTHQHAHNLFGQLPFSLAQMAANLDTPPSPSPLKASSLINQPASRLDLGASPAFHLGGGGGRSPGSQVSSAGSRLSLSPSSSTGLNSNKPSPAPAAKHPQNNNHNNLHQNSGPSTKANQASTGGQPSAKRVCLAPLPVSSSCSTTALNSLTNFVAETLAPLMEEEEEEDDRRRTGATTHRKSLSENRASFGSAASSGSSHKSSSSPAKPRNQLSSSSASSRSPDNYPAPLSERRISSSASSQNGDQPIKHQHQHQHQHQEQQLASKSPADLMGAIKVGPIAPVVAINPTLAKAPPELVQKQPAWVFCTRYSDRPSSGPRTRRAKAKTKKLRDPNTEEKRPRTAFTSEQMEKLRLEFESNSYLDERRRKDLADKLGLNENQIKIWFQNKRAKMKKQNNQPNPLRGLLVAGGLYNHTTATSDCPGSGELDCNNSRDSSELSTKTD